MSRNAQREPGALDPRSPSPLAATPARPQGRTARTSGRIADRRGLTAAGAVVLILLVGLAGGTFDMLTGDGPRVVAAVSFIVGCALATLLVHREDLKAVVVLPPLLFVALLFASGIARLATGSRTKFTHTVLETVSAVVLDAPVLMIATGLTVLLAVMRWAGGRSR